MPLTSTDIVNQALQMIGDDVPLVTGVAPTFDSSTAGKAAAQLYTLCVQAAGRQFGWDFARNQVTLSASGNVAPFPMGFAFEYLYPSNGIQVWQVAPNFAAVGYDANNPAPINFSVGNAIVGGTQRKVIWVDEDNARAIYNNNPTESTWDPLFQMAVVRLLASALAMAIAGKPDVAQSMLETGGAFETLAESRQD